jgi:hypothetical protein
VLRSLSTSKADDAQRDHDFALEKDELAAWDAFALAWIEQVGDKTDEAKAAADFADRMIDRRRKYFGMAVAVGVGGPVAEPPSE